MSTYTLSEEDINKLNKNPCVLKCSGKSIIYTYEFKKHALEQRKHGISSKDIWKIAGFDISKWKEGYAKDCIKSWRNIVKNRGLGGLAKSLGSGLTGRPKTKGITDQDRIKRLELKIAYLQAENDFLAKLRAKRAESNSGQKKNID